jgi:valyl-tRNA synthetase
LKLVEQGSGLYLGTPVPTWIEADDKLIAARRHRLEQQSADKQNYLKGLEARLANPGYVASAPAQVVADTRARHAETQQLLERLQEQLAALSH